jgi:hypothetical protein
MKRIPTGFGSVKGVLTLLFLIQCATAQDLPAPTGPHTR